METCYRCRQEVELVAGLCVDCSMSHMKAQALCDLYGWGPHTKLSDVASPGQVIKLTCCGCRICVQGDGWVHLDTCLCGCHIPCRDLSERED